MAFQDQMRREGITPDRERPMRTVIDVENNDLINDLLRATSGPHRRFVQDYLYAVQQHRYTPLGGKLNVKREHTYTVYSYDKGPNKMSDRNEKCDEILEVNKIKDHDELEIIAAARNQETKFFNLFQADRKLSVKSSSGMVILKIPDIRRRI